MTGYDLLMRCRDGQTEIEQMIAQLNRLLEIDVDQAALGSAAFDLRNEISERRRRLDAERVAACRLCDQMPEPECTVLYRFFVLGQGQGQIMTGMRISTSYYKTKKRSGIAMAKSCEGKPVMALLPDWYTE